MKSGIHMGHTQTPQYQADGEAVVTQMGQAICYGEDAQHAKRIADGMNAQLAELVSLRALNAELVAALRQLTELSDHVPVLQLDNGRQSVKAVRLAAKFMAARNMARTVLDKAGAA